MKSKCFFLTLIFCSILFLSSPAFSEELSIEEATSFAEYQGQNLLRTFSEPDIRIKYKVLDDLFLNYVDLEYISRFVVGKYWKTMTKEQQEQYQDLFKRYATNVYKGFPLTFSEELKYTILSARNEGNEVVVATNIEYPYTSTEKKTFLVEFRVHKKDGKIMLTDIKVAESSLILSYRNKFYQMIREADEEIEWFLEDFELTTTSAEKVYSLPEDNYIGTEEDIEIIL